MFCEKYFIGVNLFIVTLLSNLVVLFWDSSALQWFVLSCCGIYLLSLLAVDWTINYIAWLRMVDPLPELFVLSHNMIHFHTLFPFHSSQGILIGIIVKWDSESTLNFVGNLIGNFFSCGDIFSWYLHFSLLHFGNTGCITYGFCRDTSFLFYFISFYFILKNNTTYVQKLLFDLKCL